MSTLTLMARAKHVEIREWIEHQIQSGRLSIGDRLPSERELMERFAVSRNPVQTAMSKLVEAGLVQRRRGSGTIVASTGLRSSLLRLLHVPRSRASTASSAPASSRRTPTPSPPICSSPAHP